MRCYVFKASRHGFCELVIVLVYEGFCSKDTNQSINHPGSCSIREDMIEYVGKFARCIEFQKTSMCVVTMGFSYFTPVRNISDP